jgi:hypothetical protein
MNSRNNIIVQVNVDVCSIISFIVQNNIYVNEKEIFSNGQSQMCTKLIKKSLG